MAYRDIPHDERVKAAREYIECKKLKEISLKYGISEATILDDYRYILNETDELLKKKRIKKNKKKTGKVLRIPFSKWKKEEVEEKHPPCPKCGSNEVVKNGTYPAINYIMLFILTIFSFITLNPMITVQRYRCKKCEASYFSEEQKNNILIKLWLKFVIGKLIILLRFKQGASVRCISEINANIFGMNYSAGYINKLCNKVAEKAEEKIDLINKCNQNEAKVMMFDETFPKSKEEGSTNMGIINDENGLIRGIGIVRDKKKDIESIMKKALSGKYKPAHFLSDYDKTYPVEIKKIIPEIRINKDFVHTGRQVLKDCKTAINKLKVKESTLKNFTKEKQKDIVDLKKKLMRKKLRKVIRTILKGYRKENVATGTLYIEGGLEELRILIKTFPSLEKLYYKLQKFIKKYLECWNSQMELFAKESIPLTSNITESKNSIFKSFSKKAKSYSLGNLKRFFCAVSLYENFDVKTRGINKGTNAMMRAGIDLIEFGSDNFFDAVGLTDIIFGKKNLANMEQLLYEDDKIVA